MKVKAVLREVLLRCQLSPLYSVDNFLGFKVLVFKHCFYKTLFICFQRKQICDWNEEHFKERAEQVQSNPVHRFRC